MVLWKRLPSAQPRKHLPCYFCKFTKIIIKCVLVKYDRSTFNNRCIIPCVFMSMVLTNICRAWLEKTFKIDNIAFFYYRVLTLLNIWLLGSTAGVFFQFSIAWIFARQGETGLFESGLMAGVFITPC